MISNHVYRPPPQVNRPQFYRARPYEPYTLRWLFSRATQQYQVLGTVSGTSPLAGASPSVASGDIWVMPLVSSPDGYTITPIATGDFTIDAGADESRQSFAHDVYDVSLAAFYGAGTVYVNNTPPALLSGQASGPFNSQVYKRNQDQGTISLAPLFTDVEGDSLTFSQPAGTFPTGWSLASNGDITNAPTTYGTYSFTLRVTDITGEYTDFANTVVIGEEAPDVHGDAQAAAIAEIEGIASFTVLQPVTFAVDAATPGTVVSQAPAAGEYVAEDTVFTLTISLGQVSGITMFTFSPIVFIRKR